MQTIPYIPDTVTEVRVTRSQDKDSDSTDTTSKMTEISFYRHDTETNTNNEESTIYTQSVEMNKDSQHDEVKNLQFDGKQLTHFRTRSSGSQIVRTFNTILITTNLKNTTHEF